MLKNMIVALVGVLSVAACSNSGAGNTGRNRVVVDGVEITWVDFGSAVTRGNTNFTLNRAESIYLFSRVVQRIVTLPNGEKIDANQCHDKMLKTTDPVLRKYYLDCTNQNSRLSRNPSTSISFSKFLALSEQAVVSEGSCEWLGYDKELDNAARAVGLLASTSDQRLFFAKLKC